MRWNLRRGRWNFYYQNIFKLPVHSLGHPGDRPYDRPCLSSSLFGVDSCEDSYTEDWTVVEIESSKIDASNHNHNGNDFGTCHGIPFFKLTKNDVALFQVSEWLSSSSEVQGPSLGTIPDKEMTRSASPICCSRPGWLGWAVPGDQSGSSAILLCWTRCLSRSVSISHSSPTSKYGTCRGFLAWVSLGDDWLIVTNIWSKIVTVPLVLFWSIQLSRITPFFLEIFFSISEIFQKCRKVCWQNWLKQYSTYNGWQAQ